MSEKKISSAQEFEQIRRRLVEDQKKYKLRVLICMTGCRALGAQAVYQAFKEKIAGTDLESEVAVVPVGCIGLCAMAPVMLIEPYGYLYGGVKPDDIDEIIERTLRGGGPVVSLISKSNGSEHAKREEVPFYQKQKQLVLQNCGRIDPTSIEQAIAYGSYEAVCKTLTGCNPQEVVETVTDSGLRGRGGAGFPAGMKWGFCRNSPGDEKYLICNADEGDPGAFMDRALLEGDPHRVIEGMTIAAYAIGASQGFIYVRAEYPIAVEHINLALKQAREYGFLGENLFGADFSFDIQVRIGAGAFVCGEETALIASVEGKRGVPRPRPPFPATSGYRGKPTNINNVETFANVPSILLNGSQWYKDIGTEGSKGTKIFALAGKVNNTGLVEVPMGTTLREIVYDIGMGIPDGKAFKAAQMGGPSGGCVPAQHLDVPIDYDSVKDVGAIMGSGGLIVMDENTCMVDLARYFLAFTQSESCGKCTPCRVGTRDMLTILERICAGNAELKDLDRLERLSKEVCRASLCGLGQTAPNPVLSTLRYFREEYVEHIVDKRCAAGVCKELTTFIVDSDKCKFCYACVKKCPVNAIEGGRKKVPARIKQELCTKCRACYEACRFDAIYIRGAVTEEHKEVAHSSN